MSTPTEPTWASRTPPLHEDAAEFLNEGWNEHFIEREDVHASIAHVAALLDAGIITPGEAERLRATIASHAGGVLSPADEDVHSALERVVTEELGELGAKLHTGRSRNDLVATDLRLWARVTTLRIAEVVLDLIEALVDRADETKTMLAPGYTHLQRGQPITVGHWLLAHAFAFERDARRLLQAHDAADVSSLGAGALAGNTLGIRPSVSAEALGFSRVFENSIDAVADRDFLLDAVYAYTTTSLHLSRLGEEIVIWSSDEFGFVRAPDGFATGSSMMPQKRNPDVAELARAAPGEAVGAFVDLALTLKGVPLAYVRDLQATKRALGPLVKASAVVGAMAGLVRRLEFSEERLQRAASKDALLATDLAEALVVAGIPFRHAHERVARLVREAEERGCSLAERIQAEPGLVAPLSLEEALSRLDPAASVRRRRTPGGPSLASVRAQIAKLRRSLDRSRRTVEIGKNRLPSLPQT